MAVQAYRDPSRSIEERVADLLARMTLEEKLAQLGCAWINALMDANGFSAGRAREVAPHGIGELTRISGATALRPGESAALMNQVQRYMVDGTRLGIPVLVHEEGTSGFLARDAAVFPQAIGLACTFDPGLVEEVAGVIREQMLAVGARHCLAPVLDVARDPRWGRVEETFGEDPVLCGVLGTAYVRGLQTGELAHGVLATGKHFLGHALSEGGRNHAPVHLGPRELRDVYAEPFAAAISGARLGSVMNSYSSVDGLPPAGSRTLLGTLLRDELGFEGVVVADYFAVSLLVTHHHVAKDKQEAATRALNAGLDLELPQTSCFGAPLATAIAAGDVSLATVDTAVRRVLATKFRLGLFEAPYVDAGRAAGVFETPAQRALARRAATESLVLLRNDGVLPLRAGMRRIAVIGPGSDDRRLLQGDYHYPAHQRVDDQTADEQSARRSWGEEADLSLLPSTVGEWQPGPYYTRHVTPLEGIRSLAGPATEVVHAFGCSVSGPDDSGIGEAADAAAAADVAVVVVAGRSGLGPTCTVGEARDATDLALTGHQGELVRRCAATGTPTVVVVLSGRVHALGAVDDVASALIQAFPLGEEGGAALADVLFGVASPSGRLPVSLPRNAGQIPRYLGHRAGGSTAMFYGEYTDSATTPLYPFGHGLSYTRFAYDGLTVEASDTGSPVSVEVNVTNAGDRAGDEVVQLYVSDLVASLARPESQLVGFARLHLGAGESKRVRFEVQPSRLAFHDEALRRVVEPGDFRFSAGASSSDLRESAVVELTGEVVEQPLTSLRPTKVTVFEPEPAPR
jgi:beta-glucosidase